MTIAAGPISGRQVKDLSFLLNHTSHVLATRMTAAFAEIGVTPREYCVLAHAMGGQFTQIELATRNGSQVDNSRETGSVATVRKKSVLNDGLER